MKNFLINAGLFLALASVVSLVLGIITPEDDLKVIAKMALKNLFWLCVAMVGICLVTQVIYMFF